MSKLSVKELNVTGKKVLVRVDFNVPLDEKGKVMDDTRIKAALPTIRYLLEKDARVILMSHLGRPDGQVKEELRMNSVAERLSSLLGLEVRKADDCIGPEVKKMIEELPSGQVLLLENVRFYPEEEKNDENFAQRLAGLADYYVNDAFGTAHRAHASTTGVAQFLPAAAGFLMEKEIEVLGNLLAQPKRSFVALLGGAKVKDKISIIDNLLTKVDTLLIGGGMANTFLRARGFSVGRSLLDVEQIETAGVLLEKAKKRNVEVFLPIDVLVAEQLEVDAETNIVNADVVPDGWLIADIGPQTVANFVAQIKGAGTVFWNGPVGVFEMRPFATGTELIARAMGETSAVTVVGGGDSIAALEQAGVMNEVSHVSTGGGASLEFMEGRELPGVAALHGRSIFSDVPKRLRDYYETVRRNLNP